MTSHALADTITFGLDTFGDVTLDAAGVPRSHAQVLRDVVDEAVLADRVGLACFGVGEHHRADFAISAPEVLLAAIAARTERIHLGSAVTVLSTDDPIRVFQRFSTLNAVSHGRAEVISAAGRSPSRSRSSASTSTTITCSSKRSWIFSRSSSRTSP